MSTMFNVPAIRTDHSAITLHANGLTRLQKVHDTGNLMLVY